MLKMLRERAAAGDAKAQAAPDRHEPKKRSPDIATLVRRLGETDD
jgi:hypothetical protein